MKVLTRKAARCPVFGSSSKLSPNVLPTHKDVLRFYMFVRNSLKSTSNSIKEPTVDIISERVCLEVEEIWRRASIPVVSHKRVLQLLRSYHDKYMKVLKPFKQRQKKKNTSRNFLTLKNMVKPLCLIFLFVSARSARANVTSY